MAELYILRSPSGKGYVGITSGTTARRWKSHRDNARRGVKTRLYDAIRKYGAKAFSVRTLCIGSWAYLNDLEVRAIVSYGTRHPNGYNLREGGSQTRPHPESIAKQAAAVRGRKWTEAHRQAHKEAFTPEVRARIGASGRGRPCSQETRRKRSESYRRFIAAGGKSISGMEGRQHSEATKQKMKETWARRKREGLPTGRPIGYRHLEESKQKMREARALRAVNRG